MESTLIVLVVLSLLGSVLWVMPSPHQRRQAKLRQGARELGLQVQLARLVFPRARGEAVAEERQCIAYRLACEAAGRDWRVFRLDAEDGEGLPDGWCWGRGRALDETLDRERLGTVLSELPNSVYALEGTPLAISCYWEETGDLATLGALKLKLERLRDMRL